MAHATTALKIAVVEPVGEDAEASLGLECAHYTGHVDASGFGDRGGTPQLAAGDDGLGVLSVLQRLEGTRHHGLEVAQHGVAPLELGQDPGQQTGLSPLGDSFRREAADHVKLEPDGLSGFLHRNGREEGNLVLRAFPGLAPRALSTEVRVIQLHRTAAQPSDFLARHGTVDLVAQQLGSGVAHAQGRG